MVIEIPGRAFIGLVVGAPCNSELAVAAIVDGDPPDVVLNREIVEVYGLENADLASMVNKERLELDRRRVAYRGNRRPVSTAGKTAVLVDDGAATGTTMKVAIRALKHRSPREILVALPIAPPDTFEELLQEADRIVCLSQPPHFRALSYYYRNFPQLTDEDVASPLLDANQRPRAGAGRKGKGIRLEGRP